MTDTRPLNAGRERSGVRSVPWSRRGRQLVQSGKVSQSASGHWTETQADSKKCMPFYPARFGANGPNPRCPDWCPTACAKTYSLGYNLHQFAARASAFRKNRRDVTCWCVMLCSTIPISSEDRRSVSVSTNGAKDLGKGKHLVVPSVVPTKPSGFCIDQHHFADPKLAQVVAAWTPSPESSRLTSSPSFNVTRGRDMNPQQHGDRPPIPNRARVPAERASPLNGTPTVRNGSSKPTASRWSFASWGVRDAVHGLQLQRRPGRHSEHATETTLSNRQVRHLGHEPVPNPGVFAVATEGRITSSRQFPTSTDHRMPVLCKWLALGDGLCDRLNEVANMAHDLGELWRHVR